MRPHEAELETVGANRLFYARIAEEYDRSENCVVDARLRAQLRWTLEHVVALLPPSPRTLDACGGSGNASLVLQSLGVRPTTVDVSPDMLAVYRRKAAEAGFEPDVRVAEISDFLASDTTAWDLIVFSSALHHLEDYGRTLRAAARQLASGGILVTIFDPTQVGAFGRRLRRLDYIVYVIGRQPGRLPGILRRRVSGRRPEADPGDRAERHALSGIDDLSLRAELERSGLQVVSHARLYEGRFRVTRLVFRLLRSPSAFSLVVRRPPSPKS